MLSSLNNELPYPHMVMNWKEKNRALFKWMNIQRWPILFIFGLIALVGVVNIISALSMIVIENTGQIGILKTLGITTLAPCSANCENIFSSSSFKNP